VDPGNAGKCRLAFRLCLAATRGRIVKASARGACLLPSLTCQHLLSGRSREFQSQELMILSRNSEPQACPFIVSGTRPCEPDLLAVNELSILWQFPETICVALCQECAQSERVDIAGTVRPPYVAIGR
jgi:hypothetical protein